MHVKGSSEESNARAHSITSNRTGGIARPDLLEEENGECNSSGNNCSLINGNGGKTNDVESMRRNSSFDLDSILGKIMATLGMEAMPNQYSPVRSNLDMEAMPTQYNPVRKHHNDHAGPSQSCEPDNLKRANSEINSSNQTTQRSIVDAISPLSIRMRQRSNSDVNVKPPPQLLRRRSVRRRSDVLGLRTPMISNKSPRGKVESRESFEIKQEAIHSMQTDGMLEHVSAMERLQADEQWTSQQNFWQRLAIQSSDPDTSHKELIRRSTFLVISSMTVGAGVVWCLMFVVLKEWVAALMPFIYSTSMSVILFTCICRKGAKRGYDTFAACQLTLILVLPFAVHVALGGVEKSGGVMLWSFLCPMGASFFRNANESLRWFWLYLALSGLLLVKGFWDVSDSISEDNISDMVDEDGTDAIHPISIGISPSSSQFWAVSEEVYEYEEGIPAAAIINDGASQSSSQTIQTLYFLMNIIGVKCVIFAAVFLFARELEKEYTKSEEVLLNILPSSIVKRIKQGEFPIVDHVAGVTILFADLVGFTKASAELHPNFLIGLFLRDIFNEFDELAYEHGLEKIKTIGDAYMVAGGLHHGERVSARSATRSSRYPRQRPHATNVMLLAKDMFHALRGVNRKYGLDFDLRIGVHVGPVVAGVLGLKRLAYDVWGDAVNTASRMESNGVPGLIHMSTEMHRHVEDMTDEFEYECRGEIDIKGKGGMTTFLARPRPRDT